MNISVSLLSADFGHLQDAVDSVPSADLFHIDVMDGHFVPNITYGPVIMNAVKTDKPFDVHLMVNEPEKFVPWFKNASFITFHVEATKNPKSLIKQIHDMGIHAGISLKPKTPVSKIETYLKQVDLVLVMSVEPGFAGQEFMPLAIRKIKQLVDYRRKHKLEFLIEVDGGINEKTAALVGEAGADIAVAASYVFNSVHPDENIL